MPWENPHTGARGTVTPLAAAYSQDGTTCRDFLASYVRNGAESWLQGEACRGRQGRWEVRQMRPWRRHLKRKLRRAALGPSPRCSLRSQPPHLASWRGKLPTMTGRRSGVLDDARPL